MAIILKSGQTYKDQYNDVPLTGYYCVVDCLQYDKYKEFAQIPLDVYKSRAVRINKGKPVTTIIFYIGDIDFVEYLSNNVLLELNKNIISQIYLFLETEHPDPTNISIPWDWSKWEGDE